MIEDALCCPKNLATVAIALLGAYLILKLPGYVWGPTWMRNSSIFDMPCLLCSMSGLVPVLLLSGYPKHEDL